MEVPKITLDKKDSPSAVETTEQAVNVHTVMLNSLIDLLTEKGVINQDELVMKTMTSGVKPLKG